MRTKKDVWMHKGEWFILPCPKLMIEKTIYNHHLTFEISLLKYTAYFSFVFKRKTFKFSNLNLKKNA